MYNFPFTINSKWQDVIIANTVEQKDNFINGFKLEPIITYYLKFVTKML